MPKVSDYELDHSEDFRSFEKVRGKKNKPGVKPETKKKRREKKVDF